MTFKLIFLIIILMAGILVIYFLFKSGIKNPLENPKVECLRVSGEWIEFNNGCVDSCDYRRNPEEISCIQVLTSGCECGKDKCWNGKTCEDN